MSQKKDLIFSEEFTGYWIIGGSAAGKTTVSRYIARSKNLALYDLDARIYGGFEYDPIRHPANWARIKAKNPLDWALSLSIAEFNTFGKATTNEYLELLAAELGTIQGKIHLIDGGITHPSQVVRAFDPAKMVCLHIDDRSREKVWENPDRIEMKKWVMALPKPEAKWEKFLAFDREISKILLRESKECGIKIIIRSKKDPVEKTAWQIIDYFGL